MSTDDEDTWTALAARLEALGGMLTGEVSPWDSREVLTPAGYEYKYVFVTADALASLLDEWEAAPERYGPRLAVLFARAAAKGKQK